MSISVNRSFFETFCAADMELQKTFDVAVIIPTILRPSLMKALKSVFSQDIKGTVQIIIGIDKPSQNKTDLAPFLAGLPDTMSISFFYPGYSTSVRHGGLHSAKDGGSLRCILSYMANSPHVAYLDDDNWWANHHLSDLKTAIGEKPWAYSNRYYVHPESFHPICVDQWESVGPDKGVYKKQFGGFVDPNCLMVNKIQAETILRLWNHPIASDAKGMSADRRVFNGLKTLDAGRCTNKASSFYVLDPNDGNHPGRLNLIGDAYKKAASL